MEGAALGLSPATPAFVKPGAAAPRRWASPGTRIGAVAFSPAPRRPRRSPIRGLSGAAHRRSPLSSPVSCSSSGIRSWGPEQPPVSDRGNEEFKVRAAAVPESAEESSFAAAAKPSGDGLMQTLHLGVLFVLWILFNIYFNIYNKQVLKAYPYPITITAAQFTMGTLFVLFAWATNLVKKPKISSSQLLAIVPLAIVHTLGNLFTNVSLGKVAVSFTHTIKAMEPFFSVFLSALFLGEMPSFLVLLSLVPIVGGVALASLTEVSFNWAGFLSAMASNLTNQSRNVFSKKIMANKEESLDNITLFSIITIMSFFLMAPVTLLAEGVKFTPSYLLSAGLNLREIYMRSLLAGICFHAYQQFDDYSKMVFLDADIQVFDNLDHLFDTPDGHFYAVMDCFCEKTWSYSPQYKLGYCQQCPDRVPLPAEMGSPPSRYFNSGMFVFEPSRLTCSSILEALHSIPITPFAEQDFMNVFFEKIYVPLPVDYNLILAMLWRHPENFDFDKVKVFHYCAAGSKPWRYTGKEANMDREDIKVLIAKWWEIYNDESLDFEPEEGVQDGKAAVPRPAIAPVTIEATGAVAPAACHGPSIDPIELHAIKSSEEYI